MHGTAMPPSRPDVLRRLIGDVLAGGDVVLLADSAEGRALLDQAAGDLEERRSRVRRVDASGPDGLGLGSLLASLRQQSGEDGDTDQVLERDFAALTALDASCDRIVLLVNDAHRLQPGALRYLDLVCRTSADLRLVFAGAPTLLEVIDQPQYAGLAERLARTPLAAVPASFAAPDRVSAAAPAPALRPIERAGMAAGLPAAAEATRPLVRAPALRDPAFDADDDTVAPWEFAAAAARSAPAPAVPARGAEPKPAPRVTRPEDNRRPPAADAFARPAAIRPMAPRQVRTNNPMRFDLQTAAALGAMAAGIAIYFVWSGQPTKPPSLALPAPIVQPDTPPNAAANMAPPALPPSPASPLQNALTEPPAGKLPGLALPASPPAAALPAPAAPQPSPAPPPSPTAPRPDNLATAPAAPPPVASSEPPAGSVEPTPRLPVPPKPTRVPRERHEPATRFASPAPAPPPSRSAHAAYPPESQAWYDQYDTQAYTPPPPPPVQRPWRDRATEPDPYNGWNRLDSPPPYIGTYTAGPNGQRSFRYGQ